MKKLILAGLLACAGGANAQDIIYDTFNEADQDNLFDCCNAVQLPGRDGIGPKSKAYTVFMPLKSAQVTEIDIPLSASPDGGSVWVHLVGENEGIMRSWTLSALPQGGQCCVFQALTDRNGIPITAFVSYRVEIETLGELPTGVAWNLNSEGVTARYKTRVGSKHWTKVNGPLPAVRILGRVTAR